MAGYLEKLELDEARAELDWYRTELRRVNRDAYGQPFRSEDRRAREAAEQRAREAREQRARERHWAEYGRLVLWRCPVTGEVVAWSKQPSEDDPEGGVRCPNHPEPVLCVRSVVRREKS